MAYGDSITAGGDATEPGLIFWERWADALPPIEMLARRAGLGIAVLPLVRREIPIVLDERVDPKFGTGAVKVTPAHDPNDFEIGRKHGLAEIGVIGEDGRMTAEAGADLAQGALAALRESERTSGAEIAPKLMPLTLTMERPSNGCLQ